MPQSKRSLAPLETLISHSVRNDRSGTHPTQSSDKNREFCMIQNSCGRPVANPLEETPYDQGPRHRLPPVPAGCSVRARRALQGSHGSGLALGACLGMKNIGKPCTGKRDARFEEGALVTPNCCGPKEARASKRSRAAPGQGQCSTLPIC